MWLTNGVNTGEGTKCFAMVLDIGNDFTESVRSEFLAKISTGNGDQPTVDIEIVLRRHACPANGIIPPLISHVNPELVSGLLTDARRVQSYL